MFDLAIIGAGPAGYVAAIRAAQLGMNVCLIDARAALGGTCLNVGCIPSKAMLESSHRYKATKTDLAKHGVEVGKVSLNLPAMLKRKDDVVTKLTGGIAMLMKKNKITVKQAYAKVAAAGKLVLDNGEEVLAGKILLAVGSSPIELPFAKFDHENIIDSTDALSLTAVPDHLVVIGAGVIGLEMGSVWARLGAKVSVIDVADKILTVMDADVGAEAQKLLTKQGLDFYLGAKVQSVHAGKKGTTVAFEKDGKVQELTGDKVLVAVGRKAATGGLGLAEAGIKTDARGVIEIDEHYQTSLAGVYAVGDCVRGPMLAHKGEEEGVAVVEMMAGQHGHVNYGCIPWVVYTHPEVAGVGQTEAEAIAAHGPVKVGKFKFAANGRALAVDETDGFVKVIAHATTDQILGVHMVGHNVSELIAEAAVLMEFKASAEDMARCVHAHPTMSEATKEAAMGVGGWMIHG